MVHRQTGAQQAEHHGDKAPGHEARGADIKLLGIRIGELRKEDALRAFHQLAVDDFAPAQCGCPERQIEDMVQTKRAEHAQDKTVQKRAEITRRVHQPAQPKYHFLEMRPHNRHQRANHNRRQRANNRHKA